MNIAFYVSGKATRFRHILPDIDEDDSIVVISDNKNNDDLGSFCNNFGVKYFLMDYNEIPYDSEEKHLLLSKYILDILIRHDIQFLFTFSSHILKGDILSLYKDKIINFHPSILPSYPGRKAIDQAIRNKAFLIGNTVHFIDEGVDTGPVIMQSVICSNSFQDKGYDYVLDIQIELFFKVLKCLKESRIRVINEKVVIDNANYDEYHIYPSME